MQNVGNGFRNYFRLLRGAYPGLQWLLPLWPGIKSVSICRRLGFVNENCLFAAILCPFLMSIYQHFLNGLSGLAFLLLLLPSYSHSLSQVHSNSTYMVLKLQSQATSPAESCHFKIKSFTLYATFWSHPPPPAFRAYLNGNVPIAKLPQLLLWNKA